MAYTEPLRKTLENLGYTVTWQGGGQPISVAKGGQSYSISPSEYQITGDRAYVSPETLARVTGYTPVRSTLEQKGYDVGWKGDTGQVTVQNPYGYETYSFKPEAIWGDSSYTTPERLSAIQARLTPEYEKVYSDISGRLASYEQQQKQYFQDYMSQINNYMQQYSDSAVAMLNAYQQQYSQALAQMQQLMQPDQTVPESVKLSIQILKDQTDENLKALNEEMNRRGIYQSGIAADMEVKLRKGALTDEQQIMANWLDQQHQQMYNAALQYAQMQANFAGNYANLYSQAYQKPLEMLMGQAGKAFEFQSGLGQTMLETGTSLDKWLAEQRQKAIESRLQRESEQQKQASEWQKALLPYTYMTPYQQEQVDIEKQKLTSMTPYQQQYLDILKQKAAQPSSTQARTLTRGELFGKVKSAADQLWSDVQKGENDLENGFEDLKAAILADAPEYMGKGLTRSDIYDALNYTADLLGVPRPYQSTTTVIPGGIIDLSGNPQ